MASNNIVVSACDNELYLIAYDATNGSIAYQVGHIVSGYSFPVAVNLALSAGEWQRQETLNGLSEPLNVSETVNLPKGDYNLIAVGINWGVEPAGSLAEFTVALNGTDLPGSPYSNQTARQGTCWTPTVVPFTVS